MVNVTILARSSQIADAAVSTLGHPSAHVSLSAVLQIAVLAVNAVVVVSIEAPRTTVPPPLSPPSLPPTTMSFSKQRVGVQSDDTMAPGVIIAIVVTAVLACCLLPVVLFEARKRRQKRLQVLPDPGSARYLTEEPPSPQRTPVNVDDQAPMRATDTELEPRVIDATLARPPQAQSAALVEEAHMHSDGKPSTWRPPEPQRSPPRLSTPPRSTCADDAPEAATSVSLDMPQAALAKPRPPRIAPIRPAAQSDDFALDGPVRRAPVLPSASVPAATWSLHRNASQITKPQPPVQPIVRQAPKMDRSERQAPKMDRSEQVPREVRLPATDELLHAGRRYGRRSKVDPV